MRVLSNLEEFITEVQRAGPRQSVYVRAFADIVDFPDGTDYEGYFVVASGLVGKELVRYFEPAVDDWDAKKKQRLWLRTLVRQGIDEMRLRYGVLPDAWPPLSEELPTAFKRAGISVDKLLCS